MPALRVFCKDPVDFASFPGDLFPPALGWERDKGGNKPSDPIAWFDRSTAGQADKRRLDSDINDLLGRTCRTRGFRSIAAWFREADCLQIGFAGLRTAASQGNTTAKETAKMTEGKP
jgi:hypothetical protein